MTFDPDHIIPRGAMASEIRPVALQIRYIVEYDVRYMEDRVRADLFANGHPLGLYAVAATRDDVHPSELIPRYGRDLERLVLGELSKGLGLSSRVDNLEAQVQRLHDELRVLRRPRWRKSYDALVDLWYQVKAVYS